MPTVALSATRIPSGRLNALRPGSGDRSRQRQPRQRVSPGGSLWHDLRPNTATRCPRSITSLWRSATTTNAGNTTTIRVPLAVLAALFDRLGRYEPAATIAGFALSPLTAAAVPEITTAITHLRDVLGDQTYESLARKGETMTTAAMATYAYDQIDQARAELNAVSK